MGDLLLVSYLMDKSLGVEDSVLISLEKKAEADDELKSFLIALKGHFESEKLKDGQLDFEQQLHTLELKVQDSESAAESYRLRIEELENIQSALVLREKTLKSENEQYKANEETLLKANEDLRKKVQELSSNQSLLAENTEKLNLADEKIFSEHQIVAELKHKLAEQESIISGLKTEKLTLETENATLDGQIRNLKQEVDIVKRELEEKINSAQTVPSKDVTQEEENHEAPLADEKLSELIKKNQELTSKLAEHLIAIQKLRSQLAIQETNFHTELDTQAKLLEFHKNTHEELEIQNSKMKDELMSLKEKVTSQAQYLESYESEAQAKYRELEAQIAHLQSRLQESGAIHFETDGSQDSTIILVSKAQKGGKTFSEVFNDYVQAKRDLLETQSSTNALRQSLDILTRTLEEQSPLLLEQRFDYDALLDEACQMADLLNKARLEHSRAIEELQEIKEREALLKKEFLTLKEISHIPAEDASTEPLNKQLQERVIELKLRLDEEETRTLSEIKKLELSLEKEWHDKCEALKEQLQSQAARIRALDAEREILTELLAKRPPLAKVDVSLNDEEDSSLLIANKELENACKELTSNFDQLKAQHDSLKLDRDDKVRRAANLEAQLQLHKDRMSIFNKAASLHRSESQGLRQRNLSLEKMLTNRENYCNQLAKNVSDFQANLDQALLQASNAKAECDMAKKNEEWLRQENKSLIKEKALITGRMIDLQLKIDALGQSEAITSKQTSTQVAALKEERDEATKALELVRLENAELRQAHEKALQEHQQKLDEQNAAIHAAQEKLLVASEALKNSQLRLEEKEEENKKIKEIVESISNTDSSKDAILVTLTQLQEAQEALALSRQSESQFQAICKASEDALQALNKTYEEYKASTSELISKKEEQIQSYIITEKELACKLQRLVDQRDSLSEELVSSTNRFQQHISGLDEEVTRLKDEVAQLKNENRDAEPKLIELSKAEERARHLYEKEVTAHAEKIKQYSAVQSTVADLNKEILNLKDTIAHVQKENSELRLNASAEQKSLVDEIIILKEKVSELQAANENLTDQTSFIRQSSLASDIPEPGHDLSDILQATTKKLKLSQAQIQALEATNRRLELEKKRLAEQLQTESDGRWQPSTQVTEHQARIEQLSQKIQILTESSAHLRQENSTLKSQLTLSDVKYKALSEELSLLQEQVRSLKSAVASKESALQEAHDETQRWKLKLQDVLNKTDKVSSEEHAQLKAKMLVLEEELKGSKLELKSSANTLKELEAESEKRIVAETKLRERYASAARHHKKLYEKIKAESDQAGVDLMKTQLEEANKANLELTAKVTELDAKLKEMQTSSADIQALRDELEAATKAQEAEKERYTKMHQQAIRLKKAFDGKKEENLKLTTELTTLSTEIASKDAMINTLTENLDSIIVAKEDMDKQAAVASEKISQIEAENNNRLEQLRLEKETELAALVKESETKLANLTMRHKAQLSRPQKTIEKLNKEIEDLKAQLNQGPPISSPPIIDPLVDISQQAIVLEDAPEIKLESMIEPEAIVDDVEATQVEATQVEATQVESQQDAINPISKARGDSQEIDVPADLLDEVELTLEGNMLVPVRKRSSSDNEIIDLDASPTKKPRISSSDMEASPNFASPLIETQLAPESPGALDLDSPRSEPSSPGLDADETPLGD
ncbi:Protein mlp1 [Entomophthora muscae]|uniref:Protein mlp1 n=1 Tax=Entomophthora muscae TaxID=34485 RepID=A0ACC2RRR4_9FUNG|nr:Protein mlp1 [Entomophthora muscae]